MNVKSHLDNGFIVTDRSDSSYRKILQLAKEGELIKVKNGLYTTIDALSSGMIDIDKIIPKGILCLYSAWHYYGMTTQIPDSYYVAIDRKRKVQIPKTIDITPVYQKKDLLDIGKSTVYIDGMKIAIYNRERCLCDAVKYRNKIGIDVMVEILNSYLKYPEKNLTLLSEYAKHLRVFNILSNYLDVRL